MQAHQSAEDASIRGHSVSPDEIARFGRLADRWWDPAGPMRPLHEMNPLRVAWTGRRLADLRSRHPDRKLRLLDLGCGAGLATEALADLGYDVLGVDASAEAIAAARAHAGQVHEPSQTDVNARSGDTGLSAHAIRSGRSIAYRTGSAESLLAEGQRFDAVIALEVIEHVADQQAFMALLASLLNPGGVIVLSTLNRTWRSLATAKIGAEYVLRLLPAGTHDWRRFLTPAELSRHAAAAGLRVTDIAGMVPALPGRAERWRESRDLAVNYIAALSGS